MGRLELFVQNPLTAPDTVANQVAINIYISCGDDFEFKVPREDALVRYRMRGQFQADSAQEVVQDVPVSDIYGVNPASEAAVRTVVNVKRAALETVFEREYIVASAWSWPTTKVIGDTLYIGEYPKSFFDQDFAVYGISSYHAFLRCGFEFTVRVNPSPFHQGMLIVYWMPAVDNKEDTSLASVTQYPHAFISMGQETEARIKVPYGYYARSMRLDSSAVSGYLRVCVWNPLESGTGASQVFVTVLAKAVDVEANVRGPKRALAQSWSASGAAMQKDMKPTVFEVEGTDLSSYIQTDHDSIKDLLRRPDYLGLVSVSRATYGNGWQTLAVAPSFGGRLHRALASTYTYWTGSNKVNVVSNLFTGNIGPIKMTPVYNPHIEYYNLHASDLFETGSPNALDGYIVGKALELFSLMVSVPLYSVSPMRLTIMQDGKREGGTTISLYRFPRRYDLPGCIT